MNDGCSMKLIRSNSEEGAFSGENVTCSHVNKDCYVWEENGIACEPDMYVFTRELHTVIREFVEYVTHEQLLEMLENNTVL